MANELELLIPDSHFHGTCPKCLLQLHGREHVCPGAPLPEPDQEILGAQFLDEMNVPTYRPYGVRLDEGFAMLTDSGWESNY